MREADAAIIDATLIESAARPRQYIDAPQDRAEGDAPTADDPNIVYSADDDARWVKKGARSTLGYKGFARARYFGVEKMHAQMVIAAISANPLKAANTIKLNPSKRATT